MSGATKKGNTSVIPSVFNPDGRGWPHPSVYVIDPKGMVRWKEIDMDYKKRPSNEQIHRELAKIK